jgi:hypothetical protein
MITVSGYKQRTTAALAWAKRYRAKFAPEKYQLIHFTRRRRDLNGDLASAIRIDSHQVTPETSYEY